MIVFSPNVKYSAQRIADRVAAGGYFYSYFKVHDHEMLAVLEKLTARYSLNLNRRQRTYRLNAKNLPLADLIVQQEPEEEGYRFNCWLFITTPTTAKHSAENGVINTVSKKIVALEKPINFGRVEEDNEIKMIQDFFKDKEKFKFILNKPFLQLEFGHKKYVELARLSNKAYAKNDRYKSRLRNFSWSWRLIKPSYEGLKQEYIALINKYISQQQKGKIIQQLQGFHNYLNYYGVFKGNRQQIGQIVAAGKTYLYRKTKRQWTDFKDLPNLTLNYLPRLPEYADSLEIYARRRLAFNIKGKEIPLELAKDISTFHDWMEKDIEENRIIEELKIL